MTLGELIAILKQLPPALEVPRGFGPPHSYRGAYSEVAFSETLNDYNAPELGATVGDLLQYAESAIDKKFVGWKGGEFVMTSHTPVHIADSGCTAEDDDITVYRLAHVVGLSVRDMSSIVASLEGEEG